MATLTPTARAILLHDLAAALRSHAAEPAAASLAVVRLRDRAGCTWSDLIGPSRDHGIYAGQLAAYGGSLASGITATECACAVLRHAAWASPAEMARAALLAHTPPENRLLAVTRLEALVLTLMQRETASRTSLRLPVLGITRDPRPGA